MRTMVTVGLFFALCIGFDTFVHARITCVFDFDSTLKMPDGKPAAGRQYI